MKAPDFWWEPPSVGAALLAPAALLYGIASRWRMRKPGMRAPLPLICIGNMTVGGAGKTPTAIAVAARLRTRGRRPGFLLRGYGGRERGPIAVDLAQHDAAATGDEALLLARHAPTVVSRDRPAGAALLARLGADVIVMDDGLQNPSLHKDLAIAIVDGAQGHGNGHVLPAGPLRHREDDGWPLVDALLAIGTGEAGNAVAGRATSLGKPVLRGRLAPAPANCTDLSGRPIVAFAGIGRPEKFFATLRSCGADLREQISFADHHPFTADELRQLLGRADHHGAALLTTEKDAVRLKRLRAQVPEIGQIEALAVTLAWDEPEALDRLLDRLPV